jgi:hypothetical protein
MSDDIEKVLAPKPAKAKKAKPAAPVDNDPVPAAAAAADPVSAADAFAARRRPLNVLQRLNAVQLEVDYVQKEKRQGMRYSIVSHDAVTAKVRPVLVKYGVLYYPRHLQTEQFGNRTQAFMTVRFVNIDEPADFIDVQSFGYGIDESDKGPGKAMSYAVKYALLKALGMETGDDPDLEQDTTFRTPGGNSSHATVDVQQGTVNVQQGPPAAAARSDALLKKQADEDMAFIEGLTLRMARSTSKEQLTKIHVDTKPMREQIAARNAEVYKVYLDAMKERASEIDASQQ